MGIERGGGFERYQSPETNIETGVMLETTLEKSRSTTLPDFLQLSDTVGIVFMRTGATFLKRGYFGPEMVDLYDGTLVTWESEEDLQNSHFVKIVEDTNSSRPVIPENVLFIGSENGWFAHDAQLDYPDSQFFVIGVRPEELPDGAPLASLVHELGHTFIMSEKEDLALAQAAKNNDAGRLPKRLQSRYYGGYLREHILASVEGENVKLNTKHDMYEAMGKSRGIDKGIRLFHERHAWSSGFEFLRSNTKLAEEMVRIGKTKLVKYAQRCLDTYARGFFEQRFVNGFHE